MTYFYIMFRKLSFVMFLIMTSACVGAQELDLELIEEVEDLVEAMPADDQEAFREAGERMMRLAEESGRCAPFAAGTFALVRIALASGDLERAHALFDQRPECLRQLPRMEFQRAVLAFSEQDYATAREIWQQFVGNGSELNRVKAMENIGACWQREGELDSAQFHYERALKHQGDQVNLMTLNNIVSILNLKSRYAEVRTFFEIGLTLEVKDTTALDMLYWNMLIAETMQGHEEAALNVMREREAVGLMEVPDYAIFAYWKYLMLMDDYEAFIAHRANYSAEELASKLESVPNYLVDLFDDGRSSELGRLPLSVKWVIARRGFDLARRLEAVVSDSRPVSILQTRLEQKLAEEQRWNALLMGSLMVVVLMVGGAWVYAIMRKVKRRGAAERMEFSDADHKSVQAIREALVNQSGGEEALLHLAELRELLEARQNDSLSRIMVDVDLTPTEIKLLQLIGKSYNAQECAKMLGCTKSHVYNLRSSVRKKLGLPESISLKSWVLENMGG